MALGILCSGSRSLFSGSLLYVDQRDRDGGIFGIRVAVTRAEPGAKLAAVHRHGCLLVDPVDVAPEDPVRAEQSRLEVFCLFSSRSGWRSVADSELRIFGDIADTGSIRWLITEEMENYPSDFGIFLLRFSAPAGPGNAVDKVSPPRNHPALMYPGAARILTGNRGRTPAGLATESGDPCQVQRRESQAHRRLFRARERPAFSQRQPWNDDDDDDEVSLIEPP
ncbi:hypothetical protein EAI_17512 [Harpegnathos saltator]|uniref:Uncharacterized protein n=1 Tax=Harpegnathos saltator TaxID=610380 RepID=E2BEW4_HARSA|nr:hypothetical protein EAI_17512 [Harpegnathos saltator]